MSSARGSLHLPPLSAQSLICGAQGAESVLAAMAKTRTDNTQSPSSQPEAIESEAYETLLARARRRTGGVPAERIVRRGSSDRTPPL